MYRLLLSVIFSCLILGIFCHKSSTGIWVDNGFGLTVKAELPPGEAKSLKRHMLDLLGLPPPIRHRRRRRHRHANGSAPAFLRSIYDALDERGHAPRLDPEHRATVGAADIIITFVNKNAKLHYASESHRRLMFNLNDVPMADSLIGAELRVYRESPPKYVNKDLVLQVYMGQMEKSDERVIAKAILRDRKWTSLNVTRAALSWILMPSTNFGLRLGVTHPTHKHELHLKEVGVAGGHDREDIRPFIVGFFAQPEKKQTKANSAAIHSRAVRSVSVVPKPDYKDPFKMPIMQDQSMPPEGLCSKRPLHVSFADLEWQDWVIAPEGYHANFCHGKCKFPLVAGTNATNHALIQQLVKMKEAYDKEQRPPPDACCAPIDLTTISVLYYDYSNNVVLKKFPKMIVKNCGCI